MKLTYKIIIVLLLLGIIGGSYGFYLFNKPVESLAQKTADHNVSAEALLADFENNETDANTKYLDKVVQVSGEVGKIENKSIYIKTGNPLSFIIFEMEEEQNISGISPGDQVTLKGLCTGYLMDVVIIRSVNITS